MTGDDMEYFSKDFLYYWHLLLYGCLFEIIIIHEGSLRFSLCGIIPIKTNSKISFKIHPPKCVMIVSTPLSSLLFHSTSLLMFSSVLIWNHNRVVCNHIAGKARFTISELSEGLNIAIPSWCYISYIYKNESMKVWGRNKHISDVL